MSFCNFTTDKSDEFGDDDDFIFDDSFSSDYNGDFRTNSSSSSLKWSVDARKQNEQDWLSIERILYGEECLPEDEKTREEFHSWMQAFPHLRIVGQKIDLNPVKNHLRNSVEFVDEVIAIDPPMHHFNTELSKLDHELNEKLSIRKARQGSGTSHCKAEDLEKLLRITSSGITRNQPQARPQMTNKKVIDRTSTFIIKQSSLGRKLGKIQEHKKYEMTPITLSHQKRELDNKLSYSATSSSRMGQILNVKFLYKKPELDDVKSVKSASKLPLYADIIERQKLPKNELSTMFSKSASIHHHKVNQNSIQLPPFNYELDFPVIGRGYNNQQTSSKFIKH